MTTQLSPSSFEHQCREKALPQSVWVDRCTHALAERLPGWSRPVVRARATALWQIAPSLSPEEAAEIAADWWRTLR